jgi:hypothetical protein
MLMPCQAVALGRAFSQTERRVLWQKVQFTPSAC